MADPGAILLPFFGLMLLTAVVWVYMYYRRLSFIIGNRIRPQDLTTPERASEILPESVRIPANNLRNLLELPVLFYALCLYLFLMQAKLLYYPSIPSRELTASPADINLAYKTVILSTSDDVKLHGWFIPATDEKGVLLFFHGNAGNISHRLDSLRIFHDLGLSTLILDYRGYGRSQGSISEHGTYLDAEAAWRYLTEARKIPELSRRISEQYSYRHAKMALSETLLLTGALVILAMKIKHVKWGDVRIEFESFNNAMASVLKNSINQSFTDDHD